MKTDIAYWQLAGELDKKAGNESPFMTPEDFHREIEDAKVAHDCWAAYILGFEREV